MVIMYCDKDHPEFECNKREFFRARKEVKLNMKGERQQDNLIFVVSTTKTLIPLLKLKKDVPFVFAVTPAANTKDELNLLEDD